LPEDGSGEPSYSPVFRGFGTDSKPGGSPQFDIRDSDGRTARIGCLRRIATETVCERLDCAKWLDAS